MKYCAKCGTQMSDETVVCPQCQTPSNNQTTTSNFDSKPSPKEKLAKQYNAYLCPIVVGIILILVGLIIQIPGGALTTYKSLDGYKTENYVFDNKYSSIDEYVGGDAYNYIIGASLVAGKISGAMTAKAVFIVGGSLCLCLGITLMMLQKKKVIMENSPPNNTKSTVDTNKLI